MFRVNEFKLMGIVSGDEKLSEGEFFEKFFSALEESGLSFCGSYYMLDEEGKYVSDLTFFDLYSYIQTAERDGVGRHFIEGMSPFNLHIYSNKHQVNLCKGEDSIANFIFSSEPDEVLKVKLVKVNSSVVADYDNMIEIDAAECIDQEDSWYVEKFGSSGVTVRETLMGILNPMKAKQIQKTQENL